MQFKLLFIQDNKSLKETIRAFSMSLVNDIQFVLRLKSVEEEYESLVYMKNKLKLELEGPAIKLNLQQNYEMDQLVGDVKT